MYHSHRYRTARWRHHLYWHHRRWYSGWWIAGVLITTAAFVAIASSSQTQTVVVTGTTYYHYNPWYRRALYEGEQVYVLTSPPAGYEVERLPQVETVTAGGTRYYYADADAAFYKDAGEKFVVVAAPVGAEVSSIPKDARAADEEGSDLFIFDPTSFTRTTNSAGKTVYRVEPQPPAEELKEIPQGSPSFVADGETYYYVNYSLYVQYSENG